MKTLSVRILLFLSMALVLLAVGCPRFAGSVHAHGEEIKVSAMGAENQFPNGVRLFVEVDGVNDIHGIRVFFKRVGQSSWISSAMDFEPSRSVKGEFLIRSGESGWYIPPGTRIVYSFEIRDLVGHVDRTEVQVFDYLDTRFKWVTEYDDLITVYYQPGIMEQRAYGILETAQETLNRMRPVLGIDPIDGFQIVAYNTPDEMTYALPVSTQSQGGELQSESMAFTEERVLLVHGTDPELLSTTSHEFTSLLVAEAAGPALPHVPDWLNQGLSEYGGGGVVSQPTANDVPAATISETQPDVVAFDGVERSVVEHLLTNYGENDMAELFRAIEETSDIDQALQEVYGLDLIGLDSEWRESRPVAPVEEPAVPEPGLAPHFVSMIPTPDPAFSPAQMQRAPSQPDWAADAKLQDRATTGCAAPVHQAGSITDLASLALMVGPLAMLGYGARRRRSDPKGNISHTIKHPPGYSRLVVLVLPSLILLALACQPGLGQSVQPATILPVDLNRPKVPTPSAAPTEVSNPPPLPTMVQDTPTPPPTEAPTVVAPPPTSDTEPPSPELVAEGQKIFTGPWGCESCHTIEGITAGTIGPDLTHIGSEAANRNPPQSAREYIRQSILEPEAFVAVGVERATAGIMTDARTAGISDEEVEALVAFLLAQK